MARICSIEGCDKPHFGRGWCKMHHRRWERHGDPTYVRFIVGDDEARFWANVDHPGNADECWPWRGQLSKKGYGVMAVNGTQVRAHRFSYELLVKPIAPGWTIDHVCHRPDDCLGGIECPHRACVNPSHLQCVPAGRNNHADRCISRNAQKTHCPYGHEYTPANTIIYPSGSRTCRTCADERKRAHRMNKRSATSLPE